MSNRIPTASTRNLNAHLLRTRYGVGAALVSISAGRLSMKVKCALFLYSKKRLRNRVMAIGEMILLSRQSSRSSSPVMAHVTLLELSIYADA